MKFTMFWASVNRSNQLVLVISGLSLHSETLAPLPVPFRTSTRPAACAASSASASCSLAPLPSSVSPAAPCAAASPVAQCIAASPAAPSVGAHSSFLRRPQLPLPVLASPFVL
ncbi:hypothetical protein GUJ93_ZPchr0015g6913 [Zizania palustris]|uniref:Uncharacterized protein n=1 Tax=Zizania palustris TaxID=103762 RepID=A0A8J5W718_ZIZPA|nr:hypothetical protein GUJ93_ZPchr0015g6913 [Zizania palustris]